jgi:hypothetical protein
MQNKNFRKVKNISSDMEENYKKYFYRNTSKFFSKWRFNENDMGSIFTRDDEDYELIGQVSDATFFFKKMDDESRWFVHGDVIRDEFNKREKSEG